MRGLSRMQRRLGLTSKLNRGQSVSSSIVRGKHVITRALDRHRCEQIDDGAVLQQNGVIAAIGAFEDLHRDSPGASVVGDGQQVLLPGFVNARRAISPASRAWPPGGTARHSARQIAAYIKLF